MWRIYSINGIRFVLHRLTGVALLVYLLAHIWAISAAMLGGAALFNAVMAVLAKPAFFAVELFLFGCVIFHALNGLALILAERGITLRHSEAFARVTVVLTLSVWMGAGIYLARL